MIRLHRIASPVALSPGVVKQLTDDYIVTGKSVWNRDDIKRTLFLIGRGKCAYCESKLGREAVYLEVEHFQHKKKSPHLVVEWTNLLPACRRCNGTKSDHDVEAEPIVNPFLEDPRSHFNFRRYRLRAKSVIGKKTIDVLDLNNHQRAVLARFEVGEAVTELITVCADNLAQFLEKPSSVRRTKVLSTVRRLIAECSADAHYAATSSTVLCTSREFHEIKTALETQALWDAELETLYCNAKELALAEE